MSRDRTTAHHRPRLLAQRGSALTEFAICMPIFIGIVYGSMYLSDLGRLRLKAQEIARYGAWSMAVQPQSDYEDFHHSDVTNDSEESVVAEMSSLYFNLDGSQDPEVNPIYGLGSPGKNRMTMRGVYVPRASDVQSQEVGLTTGNLNVQFSDDPGVSLGLDLVGIGHDLQSFLSGPSKRIGLNAKGQVRSRARIDIEPPIRSEDADRNLVLMKQGRDRGMDLSEWRARGQHLRDSEGNDVTTVLISDDWRMPDGASAHPAPDKRGRYAKTVAKLSSEAINGIPGGPLLAFVLNIMNYTENIPSGLVEAVGLAAQKPEAHIFSRPYISDRENSAAYSGAARSGQVPLFQIVDAESEGGAVQDFETGPLFPDHTYDSPFRRALNDRGRNFMGCRDEQKRKCGW